MTKQKQRELLGLNLQQFTEIVEAFGQPAYRARQLYEAIYRQRRSSVEQISNLPKRFREELVREGRDVGFPGVEKRFVSVDGTVRYLIRFGDGQSVETVWMPEGDTGEAGDGSEAADEIEAFSAEEERPLTEGKRSGRRFERATICVSSQVGCAVNCRFCMTALLGVQRNLSAGEIVGQILLVLNDRGVHLDVDRVNLVFMGQGEPFLNYDAFMEAVRLLVEGVGIPESRMTVSTSGIVPRIADFAQEAVRPKLAISLNGSNNEGRTRVMPINKKWDLEQLISAVREFPLRNRERLTFEYVLLADENDSTENALQVAELLRGLRAKINLIALNPGPEIPFATPNEARVLAFQRLLMKSGIPTFIRRPRGRDIYAACGQLKKTTELLQIS